MTDTLQALSSRRLTVLAGAGISVLPPSCLPSWWQLNHAVLDAMAGTARSVTALADTVVASVKEKQDAGRMPAEYTSEVIVDSLADEYFDVLGCLEGDQPNRVHAWLAALAKAKRLPAIITTNFDTLIERACEAVGAPVRVLVKPEEFADVDVAALLDDADAPLLLVKLHGSASDPATCIDTLAQRKRGLSEPVLRVVRELVEHTRLCILGWSGADLDAEPNYLYLRQSVSRPTPGFDWLMLPDATVLPAVTDLVALYDDESRARIVHGALPDWLEAWRAALDGTGVAAPAASASLDAEAARAAAVNSLQQAARAWAEARSPVTCGLVLGTLAERVDPQLGLQVREQLLESTARLEPDTRHHGIAEMHLASSLRAFGRNAEAAAHFREAVRIFRDREAIDAFGSALNEFANLLGDLGQYAEAEELYRESARISQAVDDELSHSMPLVNIARLRLKTGDYQAAMELAQEARAMATKAGEETERATTLEHIGLVLRDAGEIDEALASYREAEAIRTRLGQDTGLGYNLTHQAMILAGRAELDAARDVLARAEELAARTGQLRAQALVLLTRASIFTQTGQWSDAIASLREAIAVREQLSDPVGRLEVVISLVGMLASRGDSAAAMELGAPALQEAQARGLPGIEAEMSSNLGIACEMSGDFDRALELYTRARDLNEQIGDPLHLTTALANLANLHFRQQHYDEAAALYATVMERAREQRDPASVVRTMANLGNIAFAREDIDAAEARYHEALAEAETHGLEGLCSQVHLNLGFVYMRRQAWPDAATHLDRAVVLFGEQGDAANAGGAAWYGTHVQLQLQQLAAAHERLGVALECWDGLNHPQEADARALMAQMESAMQGGSGS